MNTILIIARLTADPQQRTVGELRICELRVAIPRRRDPQGEARGAVFVDVTTFGPLARICSDYLAKGDRGAVTGRLEFDEWTAYDGTPRRRHKIVGDQVQFLDHGAPSNRQSEAVSDREAPDELVALRARSDQGGQAGPGAA